MCVMYNHELNRVVCVLCITIYRVICVMYNHELNRVICVLCITMNLIGSYVC